MFSIWGFNRIRGTLAVAAMFLCGIALADGPVTVGNVPGGAAVISDTDSGNGQRWGRGGGRTIRYHVNDPGRFSMLKFGVQHGTSPHVAFDNSVTGGTGELLLYNPIPTESNLAGGIARWSGNAQVLIADGFGNFISRSAWTRFTIRYTQTNGAPIPLVIDSGGPHPMNAAVLGDFDVNLLFEMSLGGPSGPFTPLLDTYDSLATPPGQPPGPNVGPVLSGVTTVFYYTLAETGMTLEDHDAHLTALFDEIKPTLNTLKTQVNFMHDDWTLRWNGIQGQVSDAQNSINNNINDNIRPTLSQIQQQVQQLLGQGNGGTQNLATKQDVTNATQPVMEMLMIALGVMPCPADKAPPNFCNDFGSLKKLGGDTAGILIGLSQANNAINGKASQSSVDGILIGLSQAHAAINGKSSQQSVDALASRLGGLESAVAELQATLDNTASQSLDVRAVQVDSGDPKKLRWIVKVTRDGALVNASLTRFATVRGYSAMSNVMPNAVITSLGTGLHDVVLSITKDAPEGVAYLFEAKIIGPSDIVGSALMVTEKKGASPF